MPKPKPVQSKLFFWLLTSVTAILCICLCLLITPVKHKAHAAAGINQQISFQGRLLTASGAVVADGNYNMEFKIYQDGNGCVGGGSSPCSGTLKWTETRTSSNTVTVKNGYFSVYLGSVTAFGSSVNWNQDTLWLSINIGGTSGTPSWDGEMLPFTRLGATPYALNSNQLGGLTSSNFVQLAPSAVQADTSTTSSVFVNKTGASGNILEFQKGGTDVMTLSNTGTLNLQNSANSTSAFTIQNAAGTARLINVDTTADATNLITNPSFEANTTGWAAKGTGTLTRITTQQYYGQASLQIASGASNNGGAQYNYALASTTTYTLSMYVKGNTGISTINIGRQENGSSDTDCLTGQTIVTTGWTHFTCTFTTGTTSGTPNIYIKDTSNTHTFYVDAVQLVQASSASAYREGYINFDGSIDSATTFQNTNNSTTALQVQNAAGATILNVDTINGTIGVGTAVSGTNNKLVVNPNNTADSLATVQINTSVATNKGLVVQGFSSQSANLQDWQKSDGTILTRVDSNGYVGVNTGTNAAIGKLDLRMQSGNTNPLLTFYNEGITGVGVNKAWYVKMGSDGDYAGNLKFYSSLASGEDNWAFALTADPSPGASSKYFFSAPAFKSAINGRGDSNVLAWTNDASNNFSGTLDVGESYAGGASPATFARLNDWIGDTSTSYYQLLSYHASTVLFKVAGDTGAALFQSASNNSGALKVEDSGGQVLFSVDTTARSGSGGNLVKIGDSTGTDGATTILQLDSATSDPTSNLSALNGGLFYNSTSNKVKIIENGTVKTLCNLTDAGCGAAGATTLQNAYDNSSSPATITLADAKNLVINAAATATDPSILFNLQCVSSCGNNGIFAVQSSGTNVLRVDPNGNTNLGIGGLASTVQIGNTTGAVAQTINIGNNATASSSTALTLGSSIGSSATTINAGTGNLTIGNNTVANTIQIGNTSSSVSQTITVGNSLFLGDNSNFNVTVNGTASSLLQSWSTNSNALPAIRTFYGQTAVAANGYIYALGGLNVTAQTTVYYSTINKDGSTGSWTTNSNGLPGVRYGGTSTAANGYIYYIGGNDSGGNPQSTVYYAKLNPDGSIGAWSTNSNALPALRAHHSTVVANGYIYVIGGYNAGAQSTVYYAKLNPDGSIGAWSTNSNALPATRYAGSAYVANGYVYYLAGGDSSTNPTSTVYYATLNKDGSTGAWSTNTNALPGNRAYTFGTISNGYIYLMGGRSVSSGTQQSTVYYASLNADGSIGTWSSNSNALPTTLEGSATAVTNGYVYVLGGSSNGSNAVATVYYSSASRLKVGSSLDLVGLNSGSLNNIGDYTVGSVGGSITAGNGTFIGALQVNGLANFTTDVGIGGALAVQGGGYINAGTAATKGLIVQGAASQTANLQEWQNSAGTVLASINASGNFIPTLGTANSSTYLCQNASNQVATCNTTGTGAAFVQGGNSFGALATLGTNDANNLAIETNGTTRLTIDQSNNIYLGNGITAATPNNFAVLGTGSTTAGTAGGALTFQGGAGATTTTGSVGGAATIQGGTSGGSNANAGGLVTIQGGTPSATGVGGGVTIVTGAGGSTSGNSGALSLTTGNTTSGTAGNISIDVGTSTSGTGSILIGNAARAETVTIGNTTGATGVTLQAGTGNLNLGTGGIGNTIQLGTITGAVTQTINIGNNSTASSTNNVNIGSSVAGTVALTGSTTITNRTSGSADTLLVNNSTSSGKILNLQSNGSSILTASSTGALLAKNATNSTTALTVQNSSGENLFNVDTSTTANLLTNGDFETNTSGWTAKGSAVLSTVTTSQQQGNASMQIATTANANDGAQYNYALAASTTYTISFYAKVSSGSISTFEYGRSNDTGAADTSCQTGQTLTTSWTRFSCSVTMGGTVSGTRYIYMKQTDAVSRNILIDAVQLEAASSSTAFSPGGAVQILGLVDSPLSIKPLQDSTSVFNVQNSAGTNVLTVDTLNQRIGLGGTPANAVLTVGTNTTTASGGIYLGTDTNLYRSAANTLKTDSNHIVAGHSALGATATIDSCIYVGCGSTTIVNHIAELTTNATNSTNIGTLSEYGIAPSVNSTTLYYFADANYAQTESGNSSNITGTVFGGANYADILGSGTVTAATALYAKSSGAASAIVTNSYGLYIESANYASGATITNNYGAIIKAQTTTGANDYGLAVEAASTQTLWISSNADNTTASAGIAFGLSHDTNLYRSAASTLKTDTALSVGTTLTVGTLGSASNSTYLCRNASNQVATCNTTGTGAAFVQGGNSFGAQAVLGTNDSNSLAVETAGTVRETYDTTNNIYYGLGITNAAPTAFTLNGTGGSGSNIAGANLVIAGGKGTGNAAGGNILFQTSTAGSSGSTLESLATVAQITGSTLEVNSTGTPGTNENFRVNLPNTVDNNTVAIITNTGATTNHILTLQGVSGQFSGYLVNENNGGTVLSSIDYLGNFRAPAGSTANPGLSFQAEATLGLYRPSAGVIAVTANAEIARFLSSGLEIKSTGAPGTVENFRVNLPTTVDNLANAIIATSATTSKGLVVQGIASQSANLQEWQSSAGAVLASVNASGNFIPTLGTTNTATYLCQNSSSQIAACQTNVTGSAFVQGGNSFGGQAILGTNDGNSLAIRTNGQTAATIASGGATTFQNNANSTAAFAVNNSNGLSLFNIDNSSTNTSNLITNPSFETNTTGWAARTGCTLARVTTTAFNGNASAQCVNTATANAGVTYGVALTSTTTYNLIVYVRSDSASGNFSTMEIGRADDGATDTSCATAQTVLITGWVRLICSFTTGTTSGSPYIYVKQTDATARTWYVDAAVLQLQTNADTTFYRDGKIQLDGVVTTPLTLQNKENSSTAFAIDNAAGGQVMTVDTTDDNLVANPSFEVSTSGWAVKGNAAATIARSAAQQQFGNASLLVTTTANANDGAQYTLPLAIAVGQQVTLSVYVRLNATAFGAGTLVGGYVNGSGDNTCVLSPAISATVPSTSGWTRFNCTFTVATTQATAIFFKQTDAVARSFFLDGVQLENGATATAYGLGRFLLNGEVISPVAFRNQSDNTSAFQIVNAASTTTLFAVDTLNSLTTENSTTAANNAFTFTANSLTTGNGLTLNTTGLTSGNGLIINGPTSGSTLTGNLLNVNTASTGAASNGFVRFQFSGAHTGNGLQVNDSTATGTAVAINANSVTSGTGLSVIGTNATLTGNIFLAQSASTGAATNGLARFNFSAAHTNTGLQIDDATATGNSVLITPSALTTGNGLYVHTTNSTQTGDSLLVDSNSTGASVNGLARFNFTGAHTNNGLQVDDATATGTAVAININSLTSGSGLSVVGTGTGITGTALLVQSASTGATTNGLARFNFTGAHTGNGLQEDDSTATGTAFKINANAVTSGSGLFVQGTNTTLTGNLFRVQSASTSAATNGLARFNFTGAHTGNGIEIDDVTVTGSALTVVTNSVTTGFAAEFLNSTSAAVNGIEIQAGKSSSSAGGTPITFTRSDGTIIGSVSEATLTTVAYNTTSDRRLKENISNTSLGLNDVLNLRVRDYEYKADSNKTPMTGFIAQELYQVFPGAVTVGNDTVDAQGRLTHPWQVDYGKLTPLLAIGIQDLNAKVDHNQAVLSAGLQGLTDQVNNLTARPTQTTVINNTQSNIDLNNFVVQKATINTDLSVNGSLFANGALKVLGPSNFAGTTTFEKLVTFIDKAIFNQDVTFNGSVAFNNNSGGYAVIKQGQKQIQVNFTKPFPANPIVTVSNNDGQFLQYSYKDLTPNGFTIVLKDPAPQDIQFSWTAVLVQNPQTSQAPTSPTSP